MFLLYRRFVNLIANIDGGSRGNPGPSAIGVVISGLPNSELVEHRQYIGTATNNEAEYIALLMALRDAVHMGALSLLVRCDSQLVVRQMTGQYAVHSSKLHALHRTAKELVSKIPQFSITHVPREENTEADRLVNEALDGYEESSRATTAISKQEVVQRRMGSLQRWNETYL